MQHRDGCCGTIYQCREVMVTGSLMRNTEKPDVRMGADKSLAFLIFLFAALPKEFFWVD
jgi:hypothetical protein